MRTDTSLAARIRALRQSMGKSQSAMASDIGMPLPTWRKYETGEREPGAAALGAMAGFGIDLHWLLTGDGTMWREAGYPALDEILLRIAGGLPAREEAAAGAGPEVDAALLAAVIEGIEKTAWIGGGGLSRERKVELIAALYLKVRAATAPAEDEAR